MRGETKNKISSLLDVIENTLLEEKAEFYKRKQKVEDFMWSILDEIKDEPQEIISQLDTLFGAIDVANLSGIGKYWLKFDDGDHKNAYRSYEYVEKIELFEDLDFTFEKFDKGEEIKHKLIHSVLIDRENNSERDD